MVPEDTLETPMFGVPVPQDRAALLKVADQLIKEGYARAGPSRYEERDPKHQGVAGVGRDILGTIGDFLLTRLGVGPMYKPAQQKRRLSAALEGFDVNPVDAISRAMDVDPQTALKLQENYTDNQRLQQTAKLNEFVKQAALEEAALKRREAGEKSIASMMNSLTGWSEQDRLKKYPMLLQQAKNFAKKAGIPEEELNLPEQYSENDAPLIDAFIDRFVPVGEQRRLRLSEKQYERQLEKDKTVAAQTNRSLDIRQQNANKPRASRPPVDKIIIRGTGEDGRPYVQYESGKVIKGSVKTAPKTSLTPLSPEQKAKLLALYK